MIKNDNLMKKRKRWERHAPQNRIDGGNCSSVLDKTEATITLKNVKALECNRCTANETKDHLRGIPTF